MTFGESGLPSGTSYSVTIDGIYTYTTNAPSGISVTFNGGTTHQFTFSSPINGSHGVYYITSASGNIGSASLTTAPYTQQNTVISDNPNSKASDDCRNQVIASYFSF